MIGIANFFYWFIIFTVVLHTFVEVREEEFKE